MQDGRLEGTMRAMEGFTYVDGVLDELGILIVMIEHEEIAILGRDLPVASNFHRMTCALVVVAWGRWVIYVLTRTDANSTSWSGCYHVSS